MKFSQLINMKMVFSYLLAEKISCSAMFGKKEFAIVSKLIFISMKFFISMKNFMLSRVEHEKSFITSWPDYTDA